MEMSVTDDDRKLDAFRPIRTRRVADKVASILIDAIRGGLYEPGEMLPRERGLAARLEVSRATVREAIGILERAGIVSVRRGNTGGVVVETRFIPPEVIASIEGATRADIAGLLETRRMLELSTSLLTAQRATEDERGELRRLVETLKTLAHEPNEWIAVDLQFHLKLAEFSGNPLLANYTKDTLQRLTAFRDQYPVGRESPNLLVGVRDQEETLKAIESGDRQRITRAIDDHLAAVEEHFLGERLSFIAPSMEHT